VSAHTRTYLASGDLSTKEGYVVKMSNASAVLLATDGTIGTEDLVGIVAQGGGNTNGLPVTVAMAGAVTRGIAGGTLTRGTHRYLTTDGNGKLVAAVAGKTVIAEWIGQAGASAASGDFIEIQVTNFPFVLDT